MPKLAIYNQQGEQIGQIVPPAALFKAPLKKGALPYGGIPAARQRQGSATTKTRGQVREQQTLAPEGPGGPVTAAFVLRSGSGEG